ncbi:2'-5' RNA ligase [Flaviramulus basaltis]|uniref:2'-5' RNA ligase n=1 Tax=Flaviramulus basaltis TaxID=369401 RepID=A0A1K2INN8_9FLAO|nr:mutarotase [Flaviramulus basaltis]SFZ93299.1 2'-5' RNA ligase [Flaviramulus basaltis]
MNLEKHYSSLYESSIQKINNDDYQIDKLIHDPNDNRFGITLLIRPSAKVKNEIQEFLNELKIVEPNQYYYENSDIHITVMSIISCYNGFELKHIEIPKYIDIIKKSLITNPNIEIEFKGLTASPSCIMIQGYMNNDSLNLIRNNLRENFKNTNLEESIDKQYAIQTTHSTVVRFSENLKNKSDFLKRIEDFKYYNFGTFKVKNIELVYNDWYQKEKHVKTLFKFEI